MFSLFRGKVVLVTGNTGFKGSWLSLWLHSLGAKVIGLSDGVPTKPSHFFAAGLDQIFVTHEVDICDLEAVKGVLREHRPDFLFHLAAKALVKPAFNSPVETLTVNALGTTNILAAICAECENITAVIITSDKVYENVEWPWGYRETDRLGGRDPYSASKAMAEIAIRSFFESFIKNSDRNIRLGIGRAGNVIGGGDWASDRIVPDAVRAWSAGKTLTVRNLKSTRPWQHVLEPIGGYLLLASELTKNMNISGQCYNFGPKAEQNKTVRSLVNEMQKSWPNVSWTAEIDTNSNIKESGLLKLNCDKALADLDWQPVLCFQETVEKTALWYKQYYSHPTKDIRALSLFQINEYMRLMAENDNRL